MIAADQWSSFTPPLTLRPERSPAPGPSVASAEIQGASAAPSQTFSLLLSRTGEYRLRQSREEEHA
jgi:hypothetical protein